LIGTAIGDALGLPMEGLSKRRQARLFPPPLRHRLVRGRGMISDDTEHTVMVAQSLLEAPNDVATFQRVLARRLRWWLVGVPAGVGLATLRSILKLWLGVSPARSGVWSAGNGPAMRSTLIGVYFAEHPSQRTEFVRASASLTHTDPRATVAAQAVAETAAWIALENEDTTALWTALQSLNSHAEWSDLISKMRACIDRNGSVADFAKEIGAEGGVSGYAYRSVPVSIYAALRHLDDFSLALSEIIACGGDTDTTAAITGGLVGIKATPAGIPESWRRGLVDWPLSLGFLERLAAQLHRQLGSGRIVGSIGILWPAVPIRNLAFLVIVLLHGFRRLLPPY
jgi:ADP-ribosylglycohydrolase